MNGKQRREKRGSQQKQPEVLRFFAVAFEELWYLVKLNVLLLAASIPVLTLPVSLTAALRITSLLAAEQRPPLWRTFWKTFLGEWKRALPLGWVHTLLAMLAAFGVYVYGGAALQENPAAFLPFLCLFVMLAVLTLFGLYFYSMLAMCELPVLDMLRNALILSVAASWRNAAAFFALILCNGACLMFFPITLPLAIFLLPALGLLAASFAIRPGLLRCMKPDAGANAQTE